MQTVCVAPLGRAGSDAEIVLNWAVEVAGTAAPLHETQGCETKTVEKMNHTASQYSQSLCMDLYNVSLHVSPVSAPYPVQCLLVVGIYSDM